MGLTKRVSKTRKTSMTFIQSIKSADGDATLFALIVILLMYRVISAILTCRKLCNYSQTNSKLSRNLNH